MGTKNPRINITFEEVTVEILKDLAAKARQSVASVAKALVMEALERHEDVALSRLSDIRCAKDANKKKISHEDAWK